jgi:hypothetical protein
MNSRHLDSALRLERLALCAGAILLTTIWTLWAGKDVSWDVFNHQLYLPFSLVSGRYTTDLFAAGPQSYQNPLGYLPFYGLVSAGLPSWLIGCVLALVHALAAWPLHKIACAIWGSAPAERTVRCLAVAAALVAPTFLLVAGTSSVDPICGVLVLLALVPTLTPKPNLRDWLLGGTALGLAIAIKPTNLAFALAIGAVLAIRGLARQLRWSELATFAGAALAAVVLGAGFWSAWLWETFGSPVFPLFNQYFHSPYAPEGPTVAGRFLPRSAWDYLTRPLEIAEFRAFTSTEGFAPDIRLALTLLLFAIGSVIWVVRRRTAPLPTLSLWHRADVRLAVFVLVAYVLWMATSGNSRYAIALFLLAGLLMARAIEAVLPRQYVGLTLGTVVVLQLVYYVGDGDHRYFAGPWDKHPFFRVHATDRLVQQPFLHISIGVQSFAAVAPYLNRSGALINAVGQFSLPMHGKLGDRLTERMKLWEGRTRFLFHKPPKLGEPETAQLVRQKIDLLTYRLRMRVDWSDCDPIVLDSDALTDSGRTLGKDADKGPKTTTLLSCKAVPRTDVDPELDKALIRADKVYALIEAQCPRIFGPVPMATDVGDNVFQRRYANYDVRVSVSPNEGVTLTHFRSLAPISMGTIDHVIANRGADACKAWQKLNTQ